MLKCFLANFQFGNRWGIFDTSDGNRCSSSDVYTRFETKKRNSIGSLDSAADLHFEFGKPGLTTQALSLLAQKVNTAIVTGKSIANRDLGSDPGHVGLRNQLLQLKKDHCLHQTLPT